MYAVGSLGYTRIALSVRRANERAIHLYRKFGFQVEGIRRREYAFLGQQKEFFMARALNPGVLEETYDALTSHDPTIRTG